MRIRLGIPMKLSDIAGCIDGKLYSEDKQITHITTDTRDIVKESWSNGTTRIDHRHLLI